MALLDSNLARADSLEALHRAARLGDAGAMTTLGKRMMIGDNAPLDRPQAIDWLAASAELGDTEALALLATLTAVGVNGPRDWGKALDYLRRSAVLGSKDARAQLRLLAKADGAGDDADSWRRLADAVDVEAWIQPPERTPIWESPRIRLARGFASHDVCDWLLKRVRGRMRPALMYNPASKTEGFDPHRTCSDYQFDILNTDLVLLLVRERIAGVTKLPTVAMEPPRVFHYALGEGIKAHYDRCGDNVTGYGKEGGYLGDRIVTLLLYLNDDYDGGELDFPKVGFKVKGAKGDAVYFAHIDAAGRPDPLSLHAGLTIRRGEKWVLSQWIHDRPFGVVTPRGAA
jgi:prolyl 4-hydroxylase